MEKKNELYILKILNKLTKLNKFKIPYELKIHNKVREGDGEKNEHN